MYSTSRCDGSRGLNCPVPPGVAMRRSIVDFLSDLAATSEKDPHLARISNVTGRSKKQFRTRQALWDNHRLHTVRMKLGMLRKVGADP